MQVAKKGQAADAVVASVDASAASSAVLIGEETGAELEWRAAGSTAFRALTVRPPRFGIAAEYVTQRGDWEIRAQPGAPRTTAIRLRLVCGGDIEAMQLPDCIAGLGKPWGPLSGWCGALRLHTGGTLAARIGDSAGALLLYRAAADAWRERDDAVRAGAALLGATEQLVRMARYAEVAAEAMASAESSEHGGSRYFALRARAERCLADRDLGRRAQARACLQPLSAQFAAIGEIADAANAYYNLGSMASDDGDWPAATRSLDAARKFDLSSAYPEIVGRLDILESTLDIAGGRIREAMAALDHAAVVFEKSANARWLANVHLRLARLYGQLDLWDPARVFAASALKNLDSVQAPARRAEALRVLAHAHATLRQPLEAAMRFAEARALVARDNVALRMRSLDLEEAAMLGDEAALERARAAIASDADTSPRQRALLALVHAERFARRGEWTEAAHAAQDADIAQLDLTDYLRTRFLRARVHGARGEWRAAFDLLEDDAARLRRQAQAGSQPVLRQLIGLRLLAVRSEWISLYTAAPPSARPDVAQVWQTIRTTQPERLLAPDEAVPSATRVDEVNLALATLLLNRDEESARTAAIVPQRALVRYFAAEGATSHKAVSTEAGLPIESVQARLGERDAMLVPALGRGSGIMLVLRRATVEVHATASADAVALAASILRASVESRANPEAVDIQASQLSRMLLGGLSGPQPARLWLVNEHTTAGIPWALLRWPGAGDALLGETAVSVLATVGMPPRPAPVRPSRLVSSP